jgi:HlyD family secretion protein
MKWVRLIALLLTPVAAWMLWSFTRRDTGKGFQTATVERGDIRATVSATGNTSAVVTVQVGSQVSGNIKALYADFNSKVTKGQLVAQIDPEPFQARVNQSLAALENARAALATAQANANKVKADSVSVRAQVANQKAEVARQRANERDALTKLNRAKELVASQVAARQDLDTAQATYDASVAARQAAEAQVQSAEATTLSSAEQYQVALAQVKAAQAQVKQAQAALEQSQLDLSHTRIIAPVDGIVISRNVDVGQTVAASFQAPVIFTIAQDLTRMQVDTNVDEADIGRIQVGQGARFTVDAFPNMSFQAKVTQIRKAAIVAQNVVTYDVVLAVDNPDLKLFPGMTANVRILTDKHDSVLKVPNMALRFRPSDAPAPAGQRPGGGGGAGRGPGGGGPGGGGPGGRRNAQGQAQTIYLLGENGKPEPKQVQTGISDGQFTEIASADLKEGDPVITGYLNAAKPANQQPRPGGRGPGF